MKIYPNYDVNGDIIKLKVSSKKHIQDKEQKINATDPLISNFKDFFYKAISDVNDINNDATDIAEQMAVDPDSVNIHDVQIAGEKAEMGILLTKGIMERVIRAYRELTNLRG